MAEIIPFDANHRCRRRKNIFERIVNYFKKKQHKHCMHISSNEYKSM